MIAVAILATVILILAWTPRRSRIISDSVQIGFIYRAMVTFAASNKDQFPLPSLLDAGNATINASAASKDTTANIFSVLIFQGTPAEMFISPAENNPSVRSKDDYEFERPKAAADPAKALWDPSFSTDFTGGHIGHNSYAHMLPAGPRRTHWMNSLDPNQAIIANRGPEIASVVRDSRGRVTPTLANPSSNTLIIHGKPDTWDANIAFNDGSVKYLPILTPGKRVDPSILVKYKASDGALVTDLPNYDEPDDPAGTNHFLGIFTTAGERPAEFKAIWD